MKYILFTACLILFAMGAPHSYAQTADNEKNIRANDIIMDIYDRIESDEQLHFNRIYSNYNLIEVVNTVRGDVENAVNACVENNPNIADKLKNRFGEWNDALSPIMTEAQAHLDNMIIAQDYASKEDIDLVFDTLLKERAAANDQIKKIPVTTEEACLFLHGKMDETQDHMLKLLKRTLISLPPKSQPETNSENADTQNDAADS